MNNDVREERTEIMGYDVYLLSRELVPNTRNTEGFLWIAAITSVRNSELPGTC